MRHVAARHQRGIGLIAAEALQIERVEVSCARSDQTRVLTAELKADARASVRENRRAHRCRQLRQMLVGQRQANAQSASLSQHIGDVSGRCRYSWNSSM